MEGDVIEPFRKKRRKLMNRLRTLGHENVMKVGEVVFCGHGRNKISNAPKRLPPPCWLPLRALTIQANGVSTSNKK